MIKKIFPFLLCLSSAACGVGGNGNGLSSAVMPQVDQVKMVDGDYIPPPKGTRTSRDRAAIFMQAALSETKPYQATNNSPITLNSTGAGSNAVAPGPTAVQQQRVSGLPKPTPVAKVVSASLPAPARDSATHPTPSMPETTRAVPAVVPSKPMEKPLPDIATSTGI